MPMKPTPTPEYDTFISYSQAANGQLKAALQRYAKPWYRLRAVRIFHVATTLSVTPELWPHIQNALDQTRWLILLLSPRAAESRWVKQEIEHWLRTHKNNTVLLVCTDGEIVWDVAHNDFDREHSSAVPPALFGRLSHEPLYLDFRRLKGATDLSLKNSVFLDGVERLSATLRDRPLEDMRGEEVRQHRRTRRLVKWTVAALTLLTLAATTGGILAMRSQREAIRQRDFAERQTRVSRSQLLTAQSRAVRRDQPQLGLLLAVEAARATSTDGLLLPGTLANLTATLSEVRARPLFRLESNQRALATPGRAAWVPVRHADDRLAKLDAQGNTLAVSPFPTPSPPTSARTRAGRPSGRTPGRRSCCVSTMARVPQRR